MSQFFANLGYLGYVFFALAIFVYWHKVRTQSRSRCLMIGFPEKTWHKLQQLRVLSERDLSGMTERAFSLLDFVLREKSNHKARVFLRYPNGIEQEVPLYYDE